MEDWYHNKLFGVEEFLNLPPNTFAKVCLQPYGITVCRAGYVPDVMAMNEAQAKYIVDTFITDDDVTWSEDWPASDVERRDTGL